MKTSRAVLLVCCASLACAADLRLTDGRVFREYQIVAQSGTSVTVRYKEGMAKIDKQLLPADVLANYPVDEAAAKREHEKESANKPTIYPRLALRNGETIRNAQITGQTADTVWVYDGKTGRRIKKYLLPDELQKLYPVDTNALAEEQRLAADARQQEAMAAADARASQRREVPQKQQGATAVARAAREYAEDYFRTRYTVGSSQVIVQQLNLRLSPPREVPGYTGRYQVEGKASLAYYDSAGSSFARRAAPEFVITLEQRADEIKVTDLTFHYASSDRVP